MASINRNSIPTKLWIIILAVLGAVTLIVAPASADGSHGEIDPTYGELTDHGVPEQELLFAHTDSIPEGYAGAQAGSTRTLPNGITIHVGDAAPDDIVDALASAIGEFDKVLDRNGAPLDVQLYYVDLGERALASAAPYMWAVEGVDTPASLINAQAGYDTMPGSPDMYVYVNSNRDWNTSISETPPLDGRHILRTALLHELGHGFGIISNMNEATYRQKPTTFDMSFFHNKVNTMTNTTDQSYKTSNNVWFKNTDGTWEKISAPSEFRQGSSLNHLGEYDYFPGDPGSLMTPGLYTNESIYTIDEVTGGLLSQVGWNIKQTPATPSLSNVSYKNGISVKITPNESTDSTPAVQYVYRVLTSDGVTVFNGQVDAGTSSVKLTDYMLDGKYTVYLAARTYSGYISSETSITITVENPPIPGIRSDLSDQIGRLYRAYFLRDTDLAGLIYWKDSMSKGTSLEAVSNEFAASTEFKARYGSLSNAQFVSLVYSNVLGRPGDTAGEGYWTGLLDGGLSRGKMMIGFSESPEFINLTGTSLPLSSSESKVWRLFAAVFGRTADSAGLSYWTEQQANIGTNGVAGQLVVSAEFVSTYGSLNDQQFVNQLYINVLGRPGETAGVSYWTDLMANGTTRADVVVGFSEGAEFISKTNTIK